jgi:hypothetical protein
MSLVFFRAAKLKVFSKLPIALSKGGQEDFGLWQ